MVVSEWCQPNRRIAIGEGIVGEDSKVPLEYGRHGNNHYKVSERLQ
jgi:hypothetical protein